MSYYSKMYFSLTQQCETGVPGWVGFVCMGEHPGKF